MTAVNDGKTRLDEALVMRGLVETRARAKAIVLAGEVLVDGELARSAGMTVRTGQLLTLKEKPRFVSRGGEKLDHALEGFGIDVAGAICADFGASTGGFTDCLLARGATRVYAIDVGYGQLHQRLREDDRVIVLERVNVRLLDSLPEPIDVVTIDVSFISLALVLPVAAKVLRAGGQCVPLIKPQFEAGKGQVGKGGVVRDPDVHEAVVRNAILAARQSGLSTRAITRSPLTGPAGNIEFLAHMVNDGADSADVDEMIGSLELGRAAV